MSELNCEWAVRGEHCGEPTARVSTRADTKRPIPTCETHEARARRYGFAVVRAQTWTRPCACGLDIRAPRDEPRDWVQAHNQTWQHMAWRGRNGL
jgi:hypothetical protein